MSRTIAVFCMVLAANVAVAQDFYFGVNGGYGLGAGTQTLGTNIAPSGTATSHEGVYGSLGEGLKFGVSGGYLFSNHFGAELGLSYWLGKKIESTYKDLTSSTTSGLTGSGFVAVPSLVFLSNLKPINPYGRFGLVLGILKMKQEVSNRDAGDIAEYTIEETGGLSIGFAGALGVIVPTGGAVDFFAEAALYSVTYSPDKQELTAYAINGQDRLSTVTNRTHDYRDSYLSSEQNVGLAVRRPFSSIGFSVGARITL